MSTLKIPTFVLNLQRDESRRERITKHLTELGIQFSFFAAVDGSALSHESKKKYSRSKAFLNYGREMHPNEIGCALSHYYIWELIVNNNIDECLVIEDDMSLNSDIIQLINSCIKWLPRDWNIVNFAHDIAKPINISKIHSNQNYHLCRFDSTVARTGVYMINKEGAALLCKHAIPICHVTDDVTGNTSIAGHRLYGVNPRPAFWDDEIPSSIWTDDEREAFARESRSNIHGYLMRIARKFLGFFSDFRGRGFVAR